jgi:hypothetical protein
LFSFRLGIEIFLLDRRALCELIISYFIFNGYYIFRYHTAIFSQRWRRKLKLISNKILSLK